MEMRNLQKRFYDKIFHSPDGCWYWTGDVYTGWNNNDGKRARFKVNKKYTSASRIAYELYKGPIPNGLLVCHTYDNPLCVNPNHLFLGTHTDNMRDMVRKNRHRYANKTHCKHGHLIADNFYINERGYKICKTCLNENWKKNYYKRKEKAKSICNKN